jgi:hypothetical protein
MDMFFCITLSVLALSWWWKRHTPMSGQRPSKKETHEGGLTVEEEVKRRREKDIAELKKQGYTDELIAVILPTINNGQ